MVDTLRQIAPQLHAPGEVVAGDVSQLVLLAVLACAVMLDRVWRMVRPHRGAEGHHRQVDKRRQVSVLVLAQLADQRGSVQPQHLGSLLQIAD